MIEFKDIKLKKDKWKYKFYYGKKLAFQLIESLEHPGMYFIKDEDKNLSEDFYNLTRAAENGRCIYMHKHNRNKGSATSPIDLYE